MWPAEQFIGNGITNDTGGGSPQKLRFIQVAAIFYIDGLNGIELFRNTIDIDIAKDIVFVTETYPAGYEHGRIGRQLAFGFDEFHLLNAHGRTFHVFPPGIIVSTAIVPLIYVNRVIAKGFDIVLHFPLQAVNSCQYTDDTEDTDSDTEKREEGTQFVYP